MLLRIAQDDLANLRSSSQCAITGIKRAFWDVAPLKSSDYKEKAKLNRARVGGSGLINNSVLGLFQN